MNLLILGAGGHGRVVKETAEAMGCFDFIAFLDDHNPDAIGRLDDYQTLHGKCTAAFVAIGDNKLRSLWQEKLRLSGYSIPTLIHPRAYLSPSAIVGSGTIVEPMACVNSNAVIGFGCIISISAVLDHDSKVCDFSHIDCGVILPPRSVVDSYSKVSAQG